MCMYILYMCVYIYIYIYTSLKMPPATSCAGDVSLSDTVLAILLQYFTVRYRTRSVLPYSLYVTVRYRTRYPFTQFASGHLMHRGHFTFPFSQKLRAVTFIRVPLPNKVRVQTSTAPICSTDLFYKLSWVWAWGMRMNVTAKVSCLALCCSCYCYYYEYY